MRTSHLDCETNHGNLPARTPNAPSHMLRLFLLLTLPLYALDQITKRWIVANFDLHGREDEIISGTFWLHHTANTGMAFGLFNGTAYANWAFGAISLVALAAIVIFHRKGAFPGTLSRLAVTLIIAGIFGNLTDRLWLYAPTDGVGVAVADGFAGRFMNGYVVDFLKFDFGFPPFNPWPSFNVADSCVVVAACLLVIASFTETPKDSKLTAPSP